MKKSHAFSGMDMHAIAEAWRSGSVVRSWLLDLVAQGLAEDPDLTKLRGYVKFHSPGDLPNDGKVIDDCRKHA